MCRVKHYFLPTVNHSIDSHEYTPFSYNERAYQLRFDAETDPRYNKSKYRLHTKGSVLGSRWIILLHSQGRSGVFDTL